MLFITCCLQGTLDEDYSLAKLSLKVRFILLLDLEV